MPIKPVNVPESSLKMPEENICQTVSGVIMSPFAMRLAISLTVLPRVPVPFRSREAKKFSKSLPIKSSMDLSIYFSRAPSISSSSACAPPAVRIWKSMSSMAHDKNRAKICLSGSFAGARRSTMRTFTADMGVRTGRFILLKG